MHGLNHRYTGLESLQSMKKTSCKCVYCGGLTHVEKQCCLRSIRCPPGSGLVPSCVFSGFFSVRKLMMSTDACLFVFVCVIDCVQGFSCSPESCLDKQFLSFSNIFPMMIGLALHFHHFANKTYIWWDKQSKEATQQMQVKQQRRARWCVFVDVPVLSCCVELVLCDKPNLRQFYLVKCCLVTQ